MMFLDCLMVVVMGIEILLLRVTLHMGEAEVDDDDDE
jgi:hypothetical protein